MAAYDDLNVKRIAVISVISILVTAVTVLAVQVLYFAMADIVDTRKVQAASYSRQNTVLSEQSAEISRYGVDPETGNVTVPVEETMKKMVAEAHSHDEA
ncbi:hypothetical protein LOC71_08100 [Rhodopirellula sp. JC740]|uniref:Uncharacterized protein n=1 Tax=Rhodopirellula halodulae TaxID=2894198 RepID=A0ABS8NFD1_9BACT|nr:hypothetical protein [Rhodopirellula sp. JC740]MCC9642233.1 hypothetical protein [Rhodopirellula sp. JC740]